MVRYDQQIIDLFLRGYRGCGGEKYLLKERPDQVERDKPAIDCIAVSEKGKTLAIEHTLVEPFEGQLTDNQPFLAVFERLHQSKELAVPNVLINVLAEVGAIPKGVDWNQVGERVVDWLREERDKIRPGESSYKIPGLSFDLTLFVDAMEVPDTPGGVVVGRVRPKDRPFSRVLERALATKLPKLAAARADNRILLLEDASTILGLTIWGREIDAVEEQFPELAQVESVWLAHTPVLQRENVVWFFHVWPDGVKERFKIEG